jgi:CubicO group peptidase (beta-lactamase class C family)
LFYGTHAFGIAIVRHGYLVREKYSFMTLPTSRFDIWSCTKTFTGTAWGMLLDQSRKGLLPDNQKVELASSAYPFFPKDYKITDKRKESITIRHLLTMTSDIAGEATGLYGVPTTIDQGPFEHALGYGDNRYGKKTDTLIAEPGMKWDYSGPAMAHLSPLFKTIMSQEIDGYMQEKVFNPIGIEHASWDVMGG